MYLTQGLQRSIQQTPDRIVTVFGERRRTFREFGERVARLAGALQHLGMHVGDRVSMLALNSDRYLEYVMATWWGGGVLNPLNTRWALPEIVYALDDCDVGILIVDEHFMTLVKGIVATAKRAPIVIYAGEGPAPLGTLAYEALIAESAPVEDACRGGSDLACVMYTGGTTGFPKGVMQTHLNLWSSCVQHMAVLPQLPDSRDLHVLPLFHIAALSRALCGFIAGEAHVIVSAFEPGSVLAIIEREQVGDTALVPTMILAMLAHPDMALRDLSSLKRLMYGASPTAGDMVEQLLARLPAVELSHSYGLTEACPIVSTNPAQNHSEAARKSGLSRSVGRGSLGVNVRIVDENGREVPRGIVGEISVRGPNIMFGYWGKPQETSHALRDGWLYTGDGAYMDDEGYIFIVDRLKDMIVTGGENVYSAEVENVIARHDAVLMCAVIGIPHEQWGESVHAIVMCRPGVQISDIEVRAWCRESIAGYKCPKTIEFRDTLPLSSAGKILKHELRRPHWAEKR
jgi:long-chain acyl-CoA synthetase